MGREFLNLREAAAMVGVCHVTMRRLLLDGVVPGMRVGRRWVIPREDLIEALRRGALAAAADRE